MPVLRQPSDQPPEMDDSDSDEARQSSRPEPQIVPGRQGYAAFSMAALRERIAVEVTAEIGERADLLDEIDEATRYTLVREAGEYVLAVEAVRLSRPEKAALFEAVARDVFGYGPLDALIADETISAVAIDGPQRCTVQRGMGRPEAAAISFDDDAHLRRIVERMVRRAGGEVRESEPFLELGLTLAGRPARLNVILPPLSPALHVDLRLRPSMAMTLEALAAAGCLNDRERVLLGALARSPHGLIVAGGGGSGKTTLLEALLAELPAPGGVWLVQRAAEIHVPAGMQALAVMPAAAERAGRSFAEAIAAALAGEPAVLALDELRGDEAAVFWEALAAAHGPRLLVTFRASPQPVRLHSSLRGLILRAGSGLTEEAVDEAILARLPFVVMTGVAAGVSVSEWAQDAGGGLTLTALLANGGPTGARPAATLDVPEDFWAGGG